jgi:hypothetical protein
MINKKKILDALDVGIKTAEIEIVATKEIADPIYRVAYKYKLEGYKYGLEAAKALVMTMDK